MTDAKSLGAQSLDAKSLDVKSVGAKHIPVLLDEIIEKCNIDKNFSGTILDCTFGGGGYTKRFLYESNCNVIALDIDGSVQNYVDKINDNRLKLHITNYSNYKKILGDEKVDMIVFDLGCSTMQLKDKDRGFSFMLDGELDMRMGNTSLSAKDIVNNYTQKQLEWIVKNYGEERSYKLIVQLIITARKQKIINTTRQLAEIIEGGVKRYGKIHPATRTFQALRIYVNNELDLLRETLSNIHENLKIGGLLCVVSFHSLEARIVKEYMMANKVKYNTSNKYENRYIESGFFEVLKVVKPEFAEIKRNPNARSAQLRIAKKIK
ncbi:MAG: 16S rRNA (cytosine(1402)-N(4))-methyltransferase RsmH [Pseudomonadota bacterium]